MSSEERTVGGTPATAALRIGVLTIFPEAITGYLEVGILGRAQREGLAEVSVHDLREGASDARRSVDDAPFGGGAGMVLGAEPLYAVVERSAPPRPLFLLSAAGEPFDQDRALTLSRREGFSLLCGRYEGVDERVAEGLVDGELSIGDYVLAGGELAALVIVEAVCRLLPGALGNEASVEEESFTTGLLEYPQYTRPAVFRGSAVPEVLLSGDHGRVAHWRHAAALHRTVVRRPDLIARRGGLSEDEVQLLVEHGYPLPTAVDGAATRANAVQPLEERDLQ